MGRPTETGNNPTPDVRTVTQTMALSVYCIAALSLTTPRPLEHLISRRGLLGAAAAAAALGVPPSIAAPAAAARVASWPGIEYLEPIFELKLSLVPASDVREAERLFVATRKADADRNGKLSTSELATLEPADAARWRARVALVGD